MSTGDDRDRIELLQGTLDLLILRTLLLGPAHGHAIAKAIERNSEDVLQVEQGSLYPALHRLIKHGWISAIDGTSENNRRAKFYKLTAKGRRQLIVETTKWEKLARAIAGILRPANQEGKCPECRVTDITIRYNVIRHVASAFSIADLLKKQITPSSGGERYSIHDVIADDVNDVTYTGRGTFAEISTVLHPSLQNIQIDHVTVFPPNVMFNVGADVTKRIVNFTFTNSLVNAGTYPIWSTGGGATNCAYYDIPLTTFIACFTGSTFSDNAIIAASSGYSVTKWPAPNYFPASAADVQFVNYNGGIGGDYHLHPSSPYKAKGTDGKDLGADIDAINSAIAGVE